MSKAEKVSRRKVLVGAAFDPLSLGFSVVQAKNERQTSQNLMDAAGAQSTDSFVQSAPVDGADLRRVDYARKRKVRLSFL